MKWVLILLIMGLTVSAQTPPPKKGAPKAEPHKIAPTFKIKTEGNNGTFTIIERTQLGFTYLFDVKCVNNSKWNFRKGSGHVTTINPNLAWTWNDNSHKIFLFYGMPLTTKTEGLEALAEKEKNKSKRQKEKDKKKEKNKSDKERREDAEKANVTRFEGLLKSADVLLEHGKRYSPTFRGGFEHKTKSGRRKLDPPKDWDVIGKFSTKKKYIFILNGHGGVVNAYIKQYFEIHTITDSRMVADGCYSTQPASPYNVPGVPDVSDCQLGNGVAAENAGFTPDQTPREKQYEDKYLDLYVNETDEKKRALALKKYLASISRRHAYGYMLAMEAIWKAVIKQAEIDSECDETNTNNEPGKIVCEYDEIEIVNIWVDDANRQKHDIEMQRLNNLALEITKLERLKETNSDDFNAEELEVLENQYEEGVEGLKDLVIEPQFITNSDTKNGVDRIWFQRQWDYAAAYERWLKIKDKKFQGKNPWSRGAVFTYKGSDKSTTRKDIDYTVKEQEELIESLSEVIE